MSSNEVRYKYAIDPRGKIISINEVPKEIPLREEYTCISCGLKLIAKKGEKRKPHFAHYPVSKEEISHIEKHCSFESYIHKLSKNKLSDLIEKYGLLITIPRKIICLKNSSCQSIIEEKINIKELYSDLKIKKETKVSEFIPDIVIMSNKNDIPEMFIEIKYSHGISPKKATSKHPIIEFFIKTEEDLEKIEASIIKGKSVDEINKNFISFKNLKQILNYIEPIYRECPEVLYKNCTLNPKNKIETPSNKSFKKKQINKKKTVTPRKSTSEVFERKIKISLNPTKYTEKDLPVKYKAAFAEFKYRYLLPSLNLKNLNEDLIENSAIKLNDFVYITAEETPKKENQTLYIPVETILEIIIETQPKDENSIVKFRELFYAELCRIYHSYN